MKTMIDNIFDKLDPYLRGIKRAEDYFIMEVHIKSTWYIPSHETIQNENKKLDGGLTYYMFYNDKSFDTMLEWLQTDVIDMNIEIEQKEELLEQKVAQLKEVFETSTLDELKKLKFGPDSDILKLKANTSKNKTEKKEVKEVEKQEP